MKVTFEQTNIPFTGEKQFILLGASCTRKWVKLWELILIAICFSISALFTTIVRLEVIIDYGSALVTYGNEIESKGV